MPPPLNSDSLDCCSIQALGKTKLPGEGNVNQKCIIMYVSGRIQIFGSKLDSGLDYGLGIWTQF